jgi:hypothetical protein
MNETASTRIETTTPRVAWRRAIKTAVFAAALATMLLAGAQRAVAAPPLLDSVELPLYQNHPTYHWTLPTGVKSEFLQVARSSDVNEDGYFLQKDLVAFDTLKDTQTSYADTREYKPGVYYVHIAGHDPQCEGGVCTHIQFTNVQSYDDVAPPPRGGGGGGGGGGGTADKVAPLETLSFLAVQDVDKLFVTARSSEKGKVAASGRVSVPGASKVYRFKSVSRSVGANAKVKLSLKLAKKSLRKVKRALKKRKKLKAKITVTATDQAGNKRAQKITIRLTN